MPILSVKRIINAPNVTSRSAEALCPFASFPHVPNLPLCYRPPRAPHARKPLARVCFLPGWRELFFHLLCGDFVTRFFSRVRSLLRVYFIVKSVAFNLTPSGHSVAVRRILIPPHEQLLGWWQIICAQPAFSCQLWSKLFANITLTRSSSRKSVESSQGSDEMDVSSQDYLFDSPWSEEAKTVIKDYIRYHREWIAYFEKLSDYEIRNLDQPPRKPRSKLPSSLDNSSSINTTKKMSQLSGEELNQFLKKHLVEERNPANQREEDFSATRLEDALVFLQQDQRIIRLNSAKLLASSLNFGCWLNTAFALHELQKFCNPSTPSWNKWLSEKVGISNSYARKYRTVVKMLNPYKQFGCLSVSFDSIYQCRGNIQQMLLDTNISTQWK